MFFIVVQGDDSFPGIFGCLFGHNTAGVVVFFKEGVFYGAENQSQPAAFTESSRKEVEGIEPVEVNLPGFNRFRPGYGIAAASPHYRESQENAGLVGLDLVQGSLQVSVRYVER